MGLERLKGHARKLKCETRALMYAYQDPRTPWYARAFVAMVVMYALSPIDLIPDFIPVLGYLDDIIIVPLGIYLALRMIPLAVITDARIEASRVVEPNHRSTAGLIIILTIWTILLIFCGSWIYRALA